MTNKPSLLLPAGNPTSADVTVTTDRDSWHWSHLARTCGINCPPCKWKGLVLCPLSQLAPSAWGLPGHLGDGLWVGDGP